MPLWMNVNSFFNCIFKFYYVLVKTFLRANLTTTGCDEENKICACDTDDCNNGKTITTTLVFWMGFSGKFLLISKEMLNC